MNLYQKQENRAIARELKLAKEKERRRKEVRWYLQDVTSAVCICGGICTMGGVSADGALWYLPPLIGFLMTMFGCLLYFETEGEKYNFEHKHKKER